MGTIESDDILGLIEIAANAREDNLFVSRQDVERIESLLQRYHEAADKQAFVSECPDPYVRAPWFQNRYTEYSAFFALAKGIDLADRDILDVGAGSGYDAWRLMRAGGRVTAIEYNPMLIRRGRTVVPEANWFGGFSHVLPFKNETFDIVCCNAALHHMRDVPKAMHEMLRVLRPGGWLITTGDPFRADHSDEDHEFDVFDCHPDVLLGVNESIPTFGSLVGTLVAHKDQLDVSLITSALYGMRMSAWRQHENIFDIREWPLDARRSLATASGSVSMKVRPKVPLHLETANQDKIALRAGDYAGFLTDYDAAVTALVSLLPTAFVDRPFPGERQAKFELLNGWQKPQPGKEYRTGYKRARWFLTRPEPAGALRFLVKRLKDGAPGEPSLQVLVGGRSDAVVAATLAADRWLEILIPLTGIPPATRFVCELRVSVAEPALAQFEDYVFAVKERRFV